VNSSPFLTPGGATRPCVPRFVRIKKARIMIMAVIIARNMIVRDRFLTIMKHWTQSQYLGFYVFYEEFSMQ